MEGKEMYIPEESPKDLVSDATQTNDDVLDIDVEKEKYFRPWLHNAIFAAVYFSQGVNLVFGLVFEPAYLKDHGIPDSTIGLVNGLAKLPFVVKIFFALCSDRWPLSGWGRRLPYIVLGCVISGLTWWPLAYVSPPEKLSTYLLLRLSQIAGVALADVCCDGLASEVVPSTRMSFVQALMESARSGGYIIASLVFGFLEPLGEAEQFRVVFYVNSCLSFVPIIFATLLKHHESTRLNETRQTLGFSCSNLSSIFKPRTGYFFLILFSSACVGGIKTLVYILFLLDRFKVSKEDLGFYSTIGSLGSLLGAMLYGYLGSNAFANLLPERIRNTEYLTKINLILSSIGQGMVTIWLVYATSQPSTYAIFFLSTMFGAGWIVIACGIVLTMSPPHIAGSFAAIMFIAPNLGMMLGTMGSGAIAEKIGYTQCLLIAAGLHLFPILLVLPFRLTEVNSPSNSKSELRLDPNQTNGPYGRLVEEETNPPIEIQQARKKGAIAIKKRKSPIYQKSLRTLSHPIQMLNVDSSSITNPFPPTLPSPSPSPKLSSFQNLEGDSSVFLSRDLDDSMNGRAGGGAGPEHSLPTDMHFDQEGEEDEITMNETRGLV